MSTLAECVHMCVHISVCVCVPWWGMCIHVCTRCDVHTDGMCHMYVCAVLSTLVALGAEGCLRNVTDVWLCHSHDVMQ